MPAHIRFATAVLCLSLFSINMVQAQAPNSDIPQIVGLFEGSCMRFVGNEAELRSWIASHHLPPVPGPQAMAFLGAVGPGKVYGASTATGKHAIVSYDDGACQVIAFSADALAVRQMLLARLSHEGISVATVQQRSLPATGLIQQLYRASNGDKRWLLSITSKPHPDAPSLAPEVHLMATIDTG